MIALAVIAQQTLCAGEPGKLTREVWNNIGGNKVSDLTVLPRFHGGPDSVALVAGSVAPSNTGNNYGSRLRGYVTAPVTGDYTFWESGDNAVELWLSQDSSKFNAGLLAWHTGWTSTHEWDKFDSQKTSTLRLQAGQKCYVELRHKEAVSDDHLALAWSYNEVQPSLNLTQLPGAVASQSSQWGDLVAENAIDGLTSPADGNNHTLDSAGSWWQVDLGAERSVDRVKLWNIEYRAHMRRLSNYRVVLLNANGVEVISKDFHTGGTFSEATEEWLLKGAVNASVVRVEKLGAGVIGSNILHMAEVEVFGVESAQPTVNFVQQAGVSVSQSSIYGSWGAEYAIDGNTGGDIADGITHTLNQAGAWWQTDLGSMRAIEKLVVWNRSSWENRLSNFRISLLDDTGAVVISQDFHTDGTHVGENLEWGFNGSKSAQTVRIEKLGADSNGSNFICLAEVEIMGSLDRLINVSCRVVDSSALESYNIDPLDLDDDDLLDTWEQANGFDTSIWQDGNYAYSGDPDQDYLTNFEESQLGYDPFTPDSLPGYMTLEQRAGIDYYSVREAAALSDKIYQEADTTTLVQGASTGEQSRRYLAQRMRGYITAPETGNYRFWVSGTNGVQLLLSSDDGKFRKRLIAELGPELGTGHGRNFYDEDFKWDLYVSQMSEEIQLEAGKKYFLEVLHQHGHGHNPHASVAWAQPGADRESIPAGSVSSYYQVPEDADDDSLLDSWEEQYGLSVDDNGLLDRSREGENGDFDGDGLNNRDEYIAGTNPANPDSDGDGLGDADELRSYGTDPLVSDAPSETIASTLNLVTYFDADANWTEMSEGIVSESFRGNISWNFDIPSSGAWTIHVDTSLRGAVYANEKLPVNALVDGKFAGRFMLHYGASHKSSMRIPLLEMPAGNHVLTLEIDNVLGRRMVQIDGISIRQPLGMDLNNDGTPDWFSELLAQTDYVSEHASTSQVSPFCIEGFARNRMDSLLNGQVVMEGKGAEHWYANLSLNEDGTTAYSMDFANGKQTHGTVEWVATDVIHSNDVVLRKGDSLKLTGIPDWNNDPQGIHVDLTVNGNVVASDYLATNAHVYMFNEPGQYNITVDCRHDNKEESGELIVTVKDADLPDATTVVQNIVSYWVLEDAQVSRNLFFEGGKGLNLGAFESVDDESYQFEMFPEEGGEFGVLARLWEGGPIIDVAPITSVTVTDALQNDLSNTFDSNEFPGFYRLVTPMVVLDLPPGGKVVVTIHRSGVTFPDGTKQQTFTSEDFENGITNLEFLIPVGMTGGYCHYVRIYDEHGVLIGRR